MGNTTVRNLARLSNVRVTIDYDLVFDCKAEIIAGHGIASATPTSQEVVEGDSCTFTATLQADREFDGWYSSSDFSGTPVSRNLTYTIQNVTSNITLYPNAAKLYSVNIFGDTERFTYTLSKVKAAEGEEVILSITATNEIYKFSSIYEADINGNKLSTHLSNSNPYTFTMPASDVNLYVEFGKEVKLYIICSNCSLVGQTSPITSSQGKTETITLTYDSSTFDWSGIYSDSGFTHRLSTDTTFSVELGSSDLYLYARAIPQQAIYIKENGIWEMYSEVYVKENGVWVKKEDFSDIFDTLKNYKRIDL